MKHFRQQFLAQIYIGLLRMH